jgi:hypothetical protein
VPSSATCATTACTPLGCSWPPPGYGVPSLPGCAGFTLTLPPAGSPLAARGWSSIHPQGVSAWFLQHTRAAGLPRIRLRDVRHSDATAGLAAGVPLGWLGDTARLTRGALEPIAARTWTSFRLSGLRIRCSHGCAGAWRAPAPWRQPGRAWPSGAPTPDYCCDSSCRELTRCNIAPRRPRSATRPTRQACHES